ncbi:maleylpyruvate isomerase family mycothiol-dependent enzyme [Arthrobacter sp. Br18]|uniref:maleylpyruvate isomerase family mycothiol-dependent enzyme n=1 Tax=Arthrobacter sp. Br18 TaxID=1312954 RepID=UPI000479178F|nr:maleylpyruvate isomerase family mycothiol-dependent enzyme [Arthrobacter sp. Br18]
MTFPPQDQAPDPALPDALRQARQGTAFFARKLEELSDAEFDGASLLPGWSCRHVVAHIAYNARAISRLVAWAATGVETPMYPSMEVRNDEIASGATLTPVTLRELFRDSAEQLDADWDNLPAKAWLHTVRTVQGREVPATASVWMRSRELWVHAVDLDTGANFGDLPKAVLDHLLDDVTGAWITRGADAGFRIEITDDDVVIRTLLGDGHPDAGERHGDDAVRGSDPGDSEVVVMSGGLAAITQWASGRGTSGVTARGSSAPGGAPLRKVPAAPAWL